MVLTYQKRIVVGFCVAIVLLCSVAASVYGSFIQMNHQKERVEHTHEVLSTLQSIISDLKDVQSSLRGYCITGLDEYLTPYYSSLPKVTENLGKLGELIQDNPAQVKRFAMLQEHAEKRLAIAANLLELYKTKGQEASFALIRTGVGKSEMDEIRVIIADMMTEEQKLLMARRTAVEDSSKMTMYAGIVGLLTCLSILGAVFSLINREAKRRTRTEVSLRDAFAEMERNNTETQLIGRLGDYLRSCRTEDEAYDIIAANMPKIFPGTYGSVSIFNNSRNLLQQVLIWGSGPELPKEFEPDSCWALRQGRMHYDLSDGSIPVCGHMEPIGEKIISMCLPMQAHGETIGQIFLGSPAIEHLGGHEIITVRSVGEQISLALANLQLQRALKEQSIKDPLTKLYNRRYLEETLMREFSRAQRAEKTLCVLMMDIDHFKSVNDTHGHDAGDTVLVAFARLLVQKSRKEDIACRLGGEEFVLVLPDATLEQASKRAEEICDATRKMIVKFQKQTLNVTVSIGACVYPDHGQTSEELLHHADLCLYKAKREGRNRVVLYDETVGEKIA